MKDSPPLEDDARLAPSVTGLHLTLPAPTLPAPVIDPSMVHAIMGMASDDVGSNCKLDRLFPNFLTGVSRVSNFLQLSAEEQVQTQKRGNGNGRGNGHARKGARKGAHRREDGSNTHVLMTKCNTCSVNSSLESPLPLPPKIICQQNSERLVYLSGQVREAHLG